MMWENYITDEQIGMLKRLGFDVIPPVVKTSLMNGG
jgi:hypothetical protein